MAIYPSCEKTYNIIRVTLINLSTNQLTNYSLHLADTTLILAQRSAEWCGHGPVLEQDIAITNISLDLLGQSRNFYQYAAALINQSTNQPGNIASEDSLAYLRTEREYKNLLLVELPNGDWAQTILKLYLFSQFQYLLMEQLIKRGDLQLAAIAEKSLKEISYHVRWSSEWVIRLGDGTEESHQRMMNARENLWPYTGEFFMPADYELGLADVGSLKEIWMKKVNAILLEATLQSPSASEEQEPAIFMHTGGKQGIHTEHLGFILSDLQYLQRTYPGAKW